MRDTLLVLGRQGIPVAAAATADLDTADPFADGRRIAFQDEAGFSSGHVAVSGERIIDDLPHPEVIVLTAGAIAAPSRSFSKGEGLVLPRGFSGTLKIAPGTQWFFCAMKAGGEGQERSPILLDTALARPASAGPAAEVVVGAPPHCHALNLFTDPSGMRAGVWDVTTPCERTFVPHRVHELMHIITGEVILTHRGGSRELIAAGDTILLPRGAPYAWKSSGEVVKYYCVM